MTWEQGLSILKTIGLILGPAGAAVVALHAYNRYVLRVPELRNSLADFKKIQWQLNLYVTDLLQKIAKGEPLDSAAVSRDIEAFARSEIQSAIERERKTLNPLTLEELRLLDDYQKKIQRGEPFTLDEAQDFHRLTEKWTAHLDQKKSENLGAFILGGIAGFILASLASKNR